MIAIFAFLAVGVAAGVFLRRVPNVTWIGKLLNVFIFFLLFFLGKSVGKNEAIINNLTTIGLQAFIITSAAIAGSVFVSYFVYKYFFQEKKKDVETEVQSESEELVNKTV